MSVTVFLHLNETKNDDFDLDKFDREMEKKYPETSKEISNSELFSYDICCENYSNFYQFTLRIDRKRSTFAVEYFNSNNRIWDYANFIMWLSKYFDKEKDLFLCDENYEDTLILSSDISLEKLEKWLQKSGI